MLEETAINTIIKRCTKRLAQSMLLLTLAIVPAFLNNGSCMASSESSNMQIDSRNYDFGVVTKGSKLVHHFSFTNTGNAPLTILGLHSSCGCTNLKNHSNKVYAPGDQGILSVQFDTTQFAGQISKSILVVTNENLKNVTTLTLSAIVQSEFLANPTAVSFGKVAFGEKAPPQVVQLSSNTNKDFEVEDLRYNRKIFQISQDKTALGVNLTVSMAQPMQGKNVRETIAVINNSQKLSKFIIPVSIDIATSIKVSTRRIEFEAIKEGNSDSKQFTLSSQSPLFVESTDVQLFLNGDNIDDTGLYLDLKSIDLNPNSKSFELRLKNTTDFSGNIHGRIKINSNDEKFFVDFYGLLL